MGAGTGAGTGAEAEAEAETETEVGKEEERERRWRQKNERMAGKGTETETKATAETGMEMKVGAGTGAETGTGTRLERWGGEKGLWNPPHQEMCREEGQVRPSETVKTCGEPESKDMRRGTGPGRARETRRSARNSKTVFDAMWKTGENRVEGEENVDNRVLVE